MKTLGQVIRELRDKKDLSLRELARTIRISAAFLSDIELNRRNPSPDVLSKIAGALDTSVDNLKTYDNRPVVDEIKRLTSTNPMYGFAFRKAVESNLSPEDIIKALEEGERQGKKKK